MHCDECNSYLAFTANFWGMAKTEKQALQQCRKAGGSTSLDKYGYVMYLAHLNTEVNDMGGFVYPRGHAPVKLYEKLKRKAA